MAKYQQIVSEDNSYEYDSEILSNKSHKNYLQKIYLKLLIR